MARFAAGIQGAVAGSFQNQMFAEDLPVYRQLVIDLSIRGVIRQSVNSGSSSSVLRNLQRADSERLV